MREARQVFRHRMRKHQIRRHFGGRHEIENNTSIRISPAARGTGNPGRSALSRDARVGGGLRPRASDRGLQKEWLYRWFKPDVAIGVGFWGQLPDLVLHPRKFGIEAVPWLVADGWVANYQAELNSLPSDIDHQRLGEGNLCQGRRFHGPDGRLNPSAAT